MKLFIPAEIKLFDQHGEWAMTVVLGEGSITIQQQGGRLVSLNKTQAEDWVEILQKWLEVSE